MSSAADDAILRGFNGLDRLPSAQSAFGVNRRARPPPLHLSVGVEEERRVPLKLNKLQHRESKGGLRGIFSRNKNDKSNIVNPAPEEIPPHSAFSERSMTKEAEANVDRSLLAKGADVEHIPFLTAPATSPRLGNQPTKLNLRSKSVKQSKTSNKSSPKSGTKSSPSRPTCTPAAWDPPPLFQAYPQAIKYAQLSVSTLSADSIIRISNHKRNNSLKDGSSQYKPERSRKDQIAGTAKVMGKAKSKHRRQISGSISKADCVPKLFILVTSGYLLQYAGDGSFDRLPEKMVQLGKDSVAFASDVIPGKHWVLQISQSMDTDGTPMADSRSLLSRLTFRGSDCRRNATSLLLVLTSAEEMDAWLAVFRREIEALGGKKHLPETGRPKPDDEPTQLRAQPSHRFLVSRDPDQFSNPPTPQSPCFGPPPWTETNTFHLSPENTESSLNTPVPSFRPSTGDNSVSNSVTSSDGRQLDDLRNSIHRISYMSSGQRTIVTSQCSSPTTSPTRESSATLEDLTQKASVNDVQPRPNSAAISERRRSMQTMQVPSLDNSSVPMGFRHSTYNPGTVPTPNFSVPNSSSRRYSAMKTHDEPSIQFMPVRSAEPALKGARKGPPPAITVARPLSPVQDTPSPKPIVPIFTPIGSSFRVLQQIKASVVDIPPRSPLYSPSPTTSIPFEQRRDLMDPDSMDIVNVDFPFSPRRSSILDLSDNTGMPLNPTLQTSLASPTRPAPLPPTTIVVPTILATHHVPVHDFEPTPQSEPEYSSTLPVRANTQTKLRRPLSMQVRRSSLYSGQPSTSSSSRLSPSPTPVANIKRPISAHEVKSPPGRKKPMASSLDRLKLESQNKNLANRRSMPVLISGPPPAPPPDCALPPLPRPGSGLRGNSSGSMNSSLRV